MNKKFQKTLLTSMMKIRQAEETVVDVYHEQTMKTPTHLSIGQEAVAVGVCSALKEDDQVFVSHRCHAVYLAKGGSLENFFSELCGRESGSNKGRAGSAHLSDPNVGVFTSPILGGMIPVAVGAALSFQMDKAKKIAVAFFGDAAIEEGVFAESVNFAVLKKLPVLFVCENNLYSTHTHIKDRQPPSAIFKRVRTPELGTRQVDGNDIEVVYLAAKEAIGHCRKGKGPFFLEFLTYRFREHVGPLYDYDKGYRTKKEVEAWQKQCPILRYKKKLIMKKVIAEKEIAFFEKQLKKEARSSYQKALTAAWPNPKTLTDWAY
jgi:pyruvate dehydrogenase E1 component alpha subunit